jgi:hypothetical protein
MGVFRAVARFVVAVAVVGYTLLDELLWPMFRPVIRWLAGLPLFRRVGAAVGRLPSYGALGLLAGPFIIIEPAKLGALWVVATGHAVQGTVMLLVAHALSLLVCERIFHAAYGPLMRIGWFAALLAWVFGIRDRVIAWARRTTAWRAAVGAARGVRNWVRGVLAGPR